MSLINQLNATTEYYWLNTEPEDILNKASALLWKLMGNARINDCCSARTCSTRMRARLKSGIQSGTAHICANGSCSSKGNNFGMRSAGGLSSAFKNRPVNTYNNCAHPWVWSRVGTRCCSHMHGTTHERLVVGHVVSLLPSGLLPSASEFH